jgi:hypothetical protein
MKSEKYYQKNKKDVRVFKKELTRKEVSKERLALVIKKIYK